ncbi:MAG: ASKHA domain-containing protein [Anaerolineae bacterium]
MPSGALLSEAAALAGVDLNQPCGGQGRCGRCAVRVLDGEVRRRSTVRLSAEDVAEGWALACQTTVLGDVTVEVPPQEQVERHLTTDRTATPVEVPEGYDPAEDLTIRAVNLTLTPPDMSDQTDDWSRVQVALARAGIDEPQAPLDFLRKLGPTLREGDWEAHIIYETDTWDCRPCHARLIDIRPGHQADDRLWGVAIDIGTTTVTIFLVELISGAVVAQVADYNGQIRRGEDVISRIIYASKDGGASEMQALVVETINKLIDMACKRAQVSPDDVVKATIAGNSTMMHLLLALPAASIRLAPFITGVNHMPTIAAKEIGLAINPLATVDCLPNVASYVGADITAGVRSSGMDETDDLTLFIDVGTNGEIVLGTREWFLACAASAGPAFEGAGVQHGMRATRGAIEEVWINSATYEPSIRVIGNVRPAGLCGSALLGLLAEMFMTGLMDKGGNINLTLPTDRVREGEHGPEYVIAWADETSIGRDIVITHVDIDNLLRAKAAIYAGFTVLAASVGVDLADVQRVLIAGNFGKYINVEKAIQIGLLPDLPWDRFAFLGNTAVRGAYLALLKREERERIKEIANKMTYLELSADNSFYEAFTSALFLPHTDLSLFPGVAAELNQARA